MVSNFLSPDSQPWVRALENKVKNLETSLTSLKKATTSRVSSAVNTPGGVLTLGGEKVPGEGVLNGSLEHLNGVYTLRYGHEFHGLTQYVLIVSGKASGAGEISLLGPEGQVLDSDTLEIDPEVEDATEFYFAVEFPIHTMNYEFEPEDEDGGGPDTDQEVVASYVLPDTGTLSLVTGATLDELSYEIRSANRSQVTIDTSSGVPTITGLSADGTTIDAMHDYSDTLKVIEETALELATAQQELADARAEAQRNFGELDDKLGQAFPDGIFDVDAGIDAAMNMANGKNAVTYTDVSNSAVAPGPTPTTAMGAGRRKYDMHRNRRTNGQIIGEWMWTGSAWTRLELSDAMVSSLDVGKLTAGTANVDTGVVNKLWVDGLVGKTATFSRLTLAAQNMIPGIGTLANYSGVSTEERNTLPFREFGIDTSDPSISLQGKKNGWIWAHIPVVAGERYQWSVDVRGSVPGTAFYMETRRTNAGGSRGASFGEWTDWKGPGSWVYPLREITVPGTGWNTYVSEATATADAVISLYIWANAPIGASNDTGYQWFRNLTMRAMTDGNMLVDGAVTARHLNVVPESGQGGLQIKPDGMRVIDAEGNGTVDLRVNAENYLSFYRDDAVNFSVSGDGALTAQNVSANANLFYRGTELTELLETMPRGLVYTTFREPGPHKISFAGYTSRLAYIQAQKPETDRMWRIWAAYDAMGNGNPGDDSWNLWMFAFNGGTQYNQTTWQTIRTGRQRVPAMSDYDPRLLVAEVRTDSLPWSEAGSGVFSINMSNVAGSSFNVRNIFFWIDDVGPRITASPSTPWIRPETNSDTTPTPTEQRHTGTWNMSSFQNYRSGVRRNHASGNIAGGNDGGEWRGVMFFPHTTIRSALSGATIDKVEVYLQNAHTYAHAGSTILIGTHDYASAPASSPAVASRASQHFSRGQGRWVTLPTAVGTGFANGTIKGLAVYGGSTANYATWTPSAPKLRISYKK